MDDLISVIVPVYNVENYIHACLESILHQSYKNIEVILVDDGSTDNSGSICDNYGKKDERIKVIHKRNGGLSDARNTGILYANGKYIMFVDSDDVISIDIVKYLYRLIKNNSADIGVCDPVHYYSNGIISYEGESTQQIFNSEEAIVEMLYQKSFLVAAWGKIYRKEYFNDISFPCGMIFEDSAVMYKIFDKADKIVYGNAKLYGYRHRDGSITTRKFSKKDGDILDICDELVEYMNDRGEKLKKAAKAYQTTAALRVYLNAPRNNSFDEERERSSDILKKNYMSVFKDHEIRKKLKIALFMYKFTKFLMPVVYKRINRWK